jgi:hypothetical protein
MKSEGVLLRVLISETEFYSFLFETSLPNIRVIKTGRQHSAKLSHVMGDIWPVGPDHHYFVWVWNSWWASHQKFIGSKYNETVISWMSLETDTDFHMT